MRCPYCGHDNEKDATFCSKCGQRLDARIMEEKLRTIRNIRRATINLFINRILIYLSLVSLVLLIASMMLPSLTSTINGDKDVGIGGVAWFSKQGWEYLQLGAISTGPFLTTFVLYALLVIATIILTVFCLTSLIHTLKYRDGFKVAPFIMTIFVVHFFYHSLMNGFYYQYAYIDGVHYGTSTGYSEILLQIARFLFVIPYFVQMVLNGYYNNDRNARLLIVSTMVVTYFSISNYGDFFTSTGMMNYNNRNIYLFGAMKYLDFDAFTSQMSSNTAFVLILNVIFSLIAILSVSTLLIFSLWSIYHLDDIKPHIHLILSSIYLVASLGALITSFLFSEMIRELALLDKFHYYLNVYNVIPLILSIVGFIFSIISFSNRRKVNINSNYTY